MTLGLKKQNLKDKSRIKKQVYSRFSLWRKENSANTLLATESSYCDCCNGYVQSGFGKSPYTNELGKTISIPQTANVAWLYPMKNKNEKGEYTERMSFMTESGEWYLYNNDEESFKIKAVFGENVLPLLTLDRDLEAKTVFVGERGVAFYSEESGLVTSSITDAIPAACVAKDRLFVAIPPFGIRYSKVLEVSEFSQTIEDSGTLQLPMGTGKIVDLVSFSEQVYVFFERGIARLSPAGTAKEFRVEKLEYGGGKIVAGTAGACGEKMLFFAEDGVYSFDGTHAKKICENMPIYPVCGEQVCNHGYLSGKYFVRYTDKDGEKKTVVIDPKQESGYFLPDLKGLTACFGELLFVSDGIIQRVQVGEELFDDEICQFTSVGVGFGIHGRKRIRSVTIEGEGEARFGVYDGQNWREWDLRFENGVASVKNAGFGERFSFRFILNGTSVVKKMTVETEYYG